MAQSVKWKIYYADGSTFSNLDGTWEEAPSDGVQCIVAADEERGRVIYKDGEYYAAPYPNEPYGFNDLGPFLREHVPGLKFGRTAPNEEFKAIYRAAVDDPAFERKSPRRRHDD